MNLGLVIGSVAAVGVSSAVVVWRHPLLALAQRSAAYVQEARSEVHKISWPTWDDLRKSTIVIVIIILIVGAVIGLLDLAFSKLLIDWLGRLFGG
ncbi:MAG: preprotein translocase subunit SecE [Gemmatimonadales bacterium]